MDTPHDNIPDDSIAARHLVPIAVIMGIGFPIYVARIYSRCRPQFKLSWDDYAITLAQIFSFVGFALIALSCKYGLGRHTILVSNADRSKILFYFTLQVIIWEWGVAMMRVSVAFLLIRLKNTPAWRWVLWVMIAIQIITATAGTIYTITFCAPVRAQWDLVPGAKCGSTHGMRAFAYYYSTISIWSDLVYSIMPLTFVWGLRRPLLERVVVGTLMCMGLTATAAAIVKLTTLYYQTYSGDLLRNLLFVLMWCKLEEVIGIIAASIPYLKSPTEQVFQRLKLTVPVSWHGSSSKGNSTQSLQIAAPGHGTNPNSTAEFDLPYGRDAERGLD